MPPRLDGIDVAVHQDKIDWDAVATSHGDLRFVACRMSHGGRNNGNLRVDKQGKRNQTQIRSHFPTTPRGYYHHVGNSDPEVQARHFRDTVGDVQPGEFIYLDVEVDPPADVFEHDPGFIRDILDAIENAFGLTPWLYIGQPGFYPRSDDARLHRFPLMLPVYRPEREFQRFAALMGRPTMVWQWGGGDNGATISGIGTGRVDANIILDEAGFAASLQPGMTVTNTIRGFVADPAPVSTGPLGFMPPLQRGSTGNSVRVLQTLLIEHGIFQDADRNRDGKFEAGTHGGVVRFQQSRGLPATGIVDRATWRRLANAN